jgi:threonine/homoserine/homoserine lactone efflux protein
LLVFAFVAVISTCTWTLFGIGITRLLTDQRRLRRFNIMMAALLVASLLPVIIGQS